MEGLALLYVEGCKELEANVVPRVLSINLEGVMCIMARFIPIRLISAALGVWSGVHVMLPAVSVLGYIETLNRNGIPISWVEKIFVVLPTWVLFALSAGVMVISGILLFGNFAYPQQLRSLGRFQLIIAVGFCLMMLFLGSVFERYQGSIGFHFSYPQESLFVFTYPMIGNTLKAFVWCTLAALVTLVGTRRRTAPQNTCSSTQ